MTWHVPSRRLRRVYVLIFVEHDSRQLNAQSGRKGALDQLPLTSSKSIPHRSGRPAAVYNVQVEVESERTAIRIVGRGA